MGSWASKYTGAQIDAAIERGRNLRVVNNGWIRLDSTVSTPVDLSILKIPGNYTTSFWTDGPDFGDESITPINIMVVSVNDDLYQYVEALGIKYVRTQTSNETNYGKWVADQTEGVINPGLKPPTLAVDGKTLWLDTSSHNPILKLYYGGKWVEVIPSNVMQKSIYDPQGIEMDIFKYIEDRIAEALFGTDGIDFENHINDSTIHVTTEEKAHWNNSAAVSDVNTAAQRMRDNIQSEIESIVSADIGKVEELTEVANHYSQMVAEHISNDKIHPSAEKQAEWDNKSDSNHTHHLDGRVTVDISHVSGVIPIEQLPFDVKERIYEAKSEAEVYALTKNPIHNGDAIFVESADGITWYYVINDSYLGTNQTSLAFKKFFSCGTIDWSKITNKPTTLEGYGIIDIATSEDISSLRKDIQDFKDDLPSDTDFSTITDTQTMYTTALANLNTLDTTFATFESAISILESIVS